MNIPIITVIIPVYNEEKYIDRFMNSLQSQTHKRLQIILIDGGSTDGSGALCDKWASRWNMGPDSNMGIVEVIHTSNKGVSASRNMGLSHASGDYIFFLDGDDWLEPDTLKRLYELMNQTGADLTCCGFVSRYPDGTAVSDTEADGGSLSGGESVSGVVSGDTPAVTEEHVSMSSREFMEKRLLHGDAHVWGKLFKRELIGDQKFRRELTIGEDMVFLLEYVRKCNTIVHMFYRGYDYYRNPHGAMERAFTDSAMDQVKCWDEVRLLLAHTDESLADGADLRANMLIAVMLTASRMALLDKDVLKEEKYTEFIRVLRGKIKEYKNRQAMKALDHGYRLKVRLFRMAPGLYMSLYHKHKAGK